MTINRFIPLFNSQSGAIPTASAMFDGELAVNIADGKLYTKSGSAIVTLNDTTNFVSSSAQVVNLLANTNITAASFTSSVSSGVGFVGTASFALMTAGGVAGTSGTSGIAGSSGTSGINGTAGSSGTSGTSGTLTLTGATNNGLITLNGTAPNATVESNLTFDGSLLTVNANQYISGSLTVNGLLTAISMSTQYVTSSQYIVGTSKIILNDDDLVRFAGLSIVDSGSLSPTTASIYWDSLNHKFIYENLSGSGYNSAIFIAGPKNTGSLGNEVGLTTGYIPVAADDDHIDNSIISQSADTIGIAGTVTATSFTSSIANGVGFFGTASYALAPAGTSGTAGSSGTSGANGSSGSSGTSGASGSSGISGTSGLSGTSGSSGTSGQSGTSGSSGNTGPAGSSGVSGTSGTSGTSGASGSNGTSGSSGTSGINGDIYSTTSSTSISIGTGSKTFTVDDDGLAYTNGQTVIAARVADYETRLEGPVVSYNDGTNQLVINVTTTYGSGGPYTDWQINVGGVPGQSGTSGTSGTSAQFNIDIHEFIANGSQTSFNMTQAYDINSLIVSVDGLTFNPVEDYTVSSTNLNFVTAPPSQSIVLVRAFVNASTGLVGSFTGSLLGTSSFATTASFALNAGGSGFPFSGSAVITGSLNVTNGITGSLFGTSSWAINAVTAAVTLTIDGGFANTQFDGTDITFDGGGA